MASKLKRPNLSDSVLRSPDQGPTSPSHTAKQALSLWFGREARVLPWRLSYSGDRLTSAPRRDPYATWISESMLQQTQVETVLKSFTAWMQRFPTLAHLAAANEAEVLSHWAGLGYYRRARNLWAAAQILVGQNALSLPANREALLALPGIGAYTAGAILSLAYGLPEALLDGNVTRVLSRYHGYDFGSDSKIGKDVFWATAKLWAQSPNPGVINEALMELGALVCQPRLPLCPKCPLQKSCVAKVENHTDVLPPAKMRVAMAATVGVALILRHDGKVLLVPPPQGALLQGHALFPIFWNVDSEVEAKRIAQERLKGLPNLVWTKLNQVVKHSITRYRISLTLFTADLKKPMAGFDPTRWVVEKQVEAALIPSLGRKIWLAAKS
jgi:A/G-specific adenine glycosylase